ncbi:asparagine synthase (glutamine-hydrolyzing) [Amorphus sp. MBR-141]
MCGICGIYDPERMSDLIPLTHKMADNIRHRGPDASGVWADPTAGISLGHRRLSILDISEAGRQPMASVCGRWQIVFNGEIYNHPTLRSELEETGRAPDWQGTSDTETLLAFIATNGVIESLRRAQGMFALALWDRKEARLYLARDRMGEKPLYCARINRGWAFASELKPLLALPDFRPRLNQAAITSYLGLGYVPDNLCVFEDVVKVSPGHLFHLELSKSSFSDSFKSIVFQNFDELMNSGLERREKALTISAEKSVAALEKQLLQVVDEQMLSDVPLGCFLSGGIDSSLIASLMQSLRDRPIRTFSIGFDVPRFNEAPHAAAVAAHLGTEHTEFILSEQDALSVIPELPQVYDEPFADSSQIPTVLLCREARHSVKVALTGDGGDEVFGGYNRHIIGPRLLSRLQRIPRGLRRSAGRIVSACAPAIAQENGWPRRFVTRMRLPITTLDKAIKLAPHLNNIDDLPTLYQHFTRGIQNPEALIRGATSFAGSEPTFPVGGAEWMMAMDSVSYLPGDILVKVDRAAMAASLETRAPFLDARVVSAAWGLPLEMKINEGKGKQALRSILNRHVPCDLFERPKQGFAVPLDRWLRGALREWGESLLSDDELADLAGLEPIAIRELWDLHQSGDANNGTKLWTILMLLHWLRHYRHDVVRARSADFLPAFI